MRTVLKCAAIASAFMLTAGSAAWAQSYSTAQPGVSGSTQSPYIQGNSGAYNNNPDPAGGNYGYPYNNGNRNDEGAYNAAQPGAYNGTQGNWANQGAYNGTQGNWANQGAYNGTQGNWANPGTYNSTTYPNSSGQGAYNAGYPKGMTQQGVSGTSGGYSGYNTQSGYGATSR